MLLLRVIVMLSLRFSPSHSVGRHDPFACGTIRNIQLILASHVPLHWAYWRGDNRWLRCVSDLCGNANG